MTSTEQRGSRAATHLDFQAKLLQPSVIKHLQDYVRWQAEVRQPTSDLAAHPLPETAPISINLDPTSACNYACAHCVDHDILNTGKQYTQALLERSLALMHDRGLRSVIIIGGGEPTLHSQFENLVRFIKGRDMQVGVVSNGTGLDKIMPVADQLDERDWVRLSLDSGTDATFQAMHKPKGRMKDLVSGDREPITLEGICANAEHVRDQHPHLNLGFSYIVTWPGASTDQREVASNLNEIILAAHLAQDHGFSYLSLKAFLAREQGNHRGEVMGIDTSASDYAALIARAKTNIAAAVALETDTFRVPVSTNLRALLDGTADHYKVQPTNCHMTALRQVLGIRGVALCPAYREEDRARLGGMDAYATPEAFTATRVTTAERIRGFDASQACAKVVCMYNEPNWFVERLICEEMARPGSIAKLQPGKEIGDYFL